MVDDLLMASPRPFRAPIDLDVANAPAFEASLIEHARATDGDVVVDCSGLLLLASAGVHALVEVERRLGRRIVLRHVRPSVQRVLEIAALSDWIEPCADAP
jgi:anti-anti-sigma factor